jgi:hypothetical protein
MMTTVKLSQGFVFLDSRVVIDGPALSTALQTLLADDGRQIEDGIYFIEPTLCPDNKPAILVRAPSYAFVEWGDTVDAFNTAVTEAKSAIEAQDLAGAEALRLKLESQQPWYVKAWKKITA